MTRVHSRRGAASLLIAIPLSLLIATPATSQDRMMRDDAGRGGGMHGGGFATGLGIGIVQGIITNEMNRPREEPDSGKAERTTRKLTKEKRKIGKKPPADEPVPVAHKPDNPPAKKTDAPAEGGNTPVAGPPPTTTDQPKSPEGSVPPTQAGSPPNSGVPPTTDGKKTDDPSDQGKTVTTTTTAKTEPEPKCGPDITDDVIRVLRKIRQDYNKPETTKEQRRKACNSLIDPRTGPTAWDIWGLDPTTGGDPSHPTGFKVENPPDTSPNKIGPGGRPEPNPQPGPHVVEKPWTKAKPGTWFTKISDFCAVPRPQCAATVEFFGTCQHAQVVNYVQFGFMLKLCDGVGYGVYQGSMATLMNAYNIAAYGNLGASSMQSVMANAGVDIERIMESPMDQDEIDKYLKPTMTNYMQASDEKIDHAEKQCRLHCDLTDEQKKKVTSQISGYHWEGMTTDSGRR